MKISKSLDYALRSLVLLSLYPNKKFDIHSIAKKQSIPIFYLSKLMGRLVRSGIVRSQVGPDGGYSLIRPPEQINLKEIFEAVEGKIKLLDCMQGIEDCSLINNCPLINVYDKLEKSILSILEGTTLKDISNVAAVR